MFEFSDSNTIGDLFETINRDHIDRGQDIVDFDQHLKSIYERLEKECRIQHVDRSVGTENEQRTDNSSIMPSFPNGEIPPSPPMPTIDLHDIMDAINGPEQLTLEELNKAFKEIRDRENDRKNNGDKEK